MASTDGKHPIPRTRYDALVADLAALEAQYRAALEDGDQVMRGWSDVAAKASFASSIQPLAKQIAERRAYLTTVYADDGTATPRISELSVDEIVAEARRNADVFRHELWEHDTRVAELPLPEGPIDPEEVAARLRAEGTAGELRVFKGAPGSPGERCVAVYLLARRQPAAPRD